MFFQYLLIMPSIGFYTEKEKESFNNKSLCKYL